MSTVQHEAIGRLLDIWLASLDWSKSGQSNAIVWTENVVSREHRNQQINHLSSINFFVRKTILKIWDWSPIYHYQRSLGHVWHDDEGQDDDDAAGRIGWRIKKKSFKQGCVKKVQSGLGGKYSRRVFLFIERWQFFLFSHPSKPPQKGKKTKLKMSRMILKHSIV